MAESHLRAAVAAALEAEKLLLPGFGNAGEYRTKHISAADIVTKFDTEAENLIRDILRSHDPSIGFIGEESGGEKSQERFWLVDPIDGTGHFLRGNPYCTTMIALVEKGEVTASVINRFATHELFKAEKGKGATMNGTELRVSSRPLAESYIGIEANLQHPETTSRFISIAAHCVWLHYVAPGYEFGLIASGKLDGMICIDPYGQDYDYAAGALLVKEAGGIVANIGSNDYRYQNHDFIAANPVLYENLTSGKDAAFPLDQ